MGRYRGGKSIIGLLCRIVLLTIAIVLVSCSAPSQTTQSPVENILHLFNWDGDIPQSVLDQFTAETGIDVEYHIYESQEEAIESMRNGGLYDVVVMESRFIQLLAQEGLLAEIDYEYISNFKNISPNFRGLLYDPDNLYSVPYTWGTTGLVVRTDLVTSKVTKWADLWDPQYAGKVAIWAGQPRESIALTLKTIGYSANTEEPEQLEEALAKLSALKPNLHFVEEFDLEDVCESFIEGGVVIAMGYTGDISACEEAGLVVEYILPDEGVLLWGDTFVVPANSPNPLTAFRFIDFILRPQISAEITNANTYATTNEAAYEFIDPQIIDNPIIFPDQKILTKAEIILPLTTEGQQLYDDIWQRFLDAPPQK